MGYPAERISVIQNSVDTSLYYPNSELRSQGRRSFGFSDNIRVIGHVGRFDVNKNHFGLLKAIAQCTLDANVKVLMCGTDIDDHNDNLRQMINGLGLSGKVWCIGQQRDMRHLLAKNCSCATIFILTNSRIIRGALYAILLGTEFIIKFILK